jgi:hypothetical protein
VKRCENCRRVENDGQLKNLPMTEAMFVYAQCYETPNRFICKPCALSNRFHPCLMSRTAYLHMRKNDQEIPPLTMCSYGPYVD